MALKAKSAIQLIVHELGHLHVTRLKEIGSDFLAIFALFPETQQLSLNISIALVLNRKEFFFFFFHLKLTLW